MRIDSENYSLMVIKSVNSLGIPDVIKKARRDKAVDILNIWSEGNPSFHNLIPKENPPARPSVEVTLL